MMQVIRGVPPNYPAILAVFPMASLPGVIFTYGKTIYAPSGGPISAELMAHEAVHGERQGSDLSGIENWWHRYIADPKFRLEEEIPAHQAEYREFCRNNTSGQTRNGRRLALHSIASRLASPLYGSMIRYDDARRLIKLAQQ